MLAVAFVVVQLVRAVPSPTLTPHLAGERTVKGTMAKLPYAPAAETTIAVQGVGTIASVGGDAPISIASVTKLMSCLVILHDHPLALGESGPTITITPADVAAYEHDKADDDSVLPVVAGEQLTEREALEAALIPSADNVIRLLALWDAGSTSAFVTKMNARARALGLTATHYAGPSGVDPANVSSARDEARVAEIAMANPTLAQIVAMPQVQLPDAPLQYNVNGDLGQDGIVGVKTGWVPAGGASFVFAAQHSVAGASELVIGAIVGEREAPPLPTVLSYGKRLAKAVSSSLEMVSVVHSGARVATVVSGTGTTEAVVATRSVRLLAWPGAVVSETVRARRQLRLPLAAHEQVGTLLVRLDDETKQVPLEVAGQLASPSISWRLTHL